MRRQRKKGPLKLIFEKIKYTCENFEINLQLYTYNLSHLEK